MVIRGLGDGCGRPSLLDRPWSIHREGLPFTDVLGIKV